MLHIANQVTAIPCLGVGLGYRREMKEATLAARADIDFLEVITEHYTDDDPRALRELEEISSLFPVIPHGVSLSIGSMTPLDKQFLQGIKRVCEMTQAPYYSEHLCMTSVPGIDLGHLSPLWFTEDVLQQVIRNVAYVQEYLARPLILENVTYYFDIPGNSMSQAEFFNRLIAATGCGILLDITNVFINS
ncbi:MAG: DUF692 domain-containing protein, partial [Chloroflexota bacterium]|nr:DUF692 domain-containing protein [Chloroflexota bacterium]